MDKILADFSRVASLALLTFGLARAVMGAPIEEWAIWYFTAIYLRLQAIEWSAPKDKTDE